MPTVRALSGGLDVVRPHVASALTSGRGAVVMFSGAPGAGKSTTMDALVRDLGEAGLVDPRRITRVSADETSRRQPFGVVSAVVGLRAEYPPRPETPDHVLAAVETLCGDGPVVLCLDDVHQADADSLRILSLLVLASRDLPLVLLMTRRWFPVRQALETLAGEAGVLEVEVVGLDAVGVAGMVHARWGAAPGPALLHALQTAGGNPFHVAELLTDLHATSRIVVSDGVADLTPDALAAAPVLPSMEESVRAHLALLEGEARALLEILAVWGRPAPLELLAAIADVPVDGVRAAVGPAVELEVVRGRQGEGGPTAELGFAHDLYRDVLYADLLPGLRRMLHAACAQELRTTGGRATEIVQHVGDSLNDPGAVAEALRTAEQDLRHAPEQAADLLAQVPTRPGSLEAETVALARAGALAAAGAMAEAVRVVRDALAVTRNTQVREILTRLLLHNLVHGAQTVEAVALIDEELSQPIDETYRDALVGLRRWILVLTGEVRLTGGRTSGSGVTGAALVPSAMELFLQARCESALVTVLEAEHHRETSGAPGWGNGATAPVWPAWFALYARGLEAAQEHSVQARRTAQRTGRGWLFPQHLDIAGAIDQFAGRWGDALTVYEAHWEMASGAGSGWSGRGVSGKAQILVQQGRLEEAAATVHQWSARGNPDTFGIPWAAFAELQLLEAQGDADGARRLVEPLWSRPLESGRLLWALLAGPDVARVARWLGEEGLLARVVADVGAVPLEEVPTLAVVPTLVAAIADGDATGAVSAAEAFAGTGSVMGEASGWEEAAVAAAAHEDRDAARAHAARCLTLARGLGATTIERRLAARLREHGIRLGATGTRDRPTAGPGSLTPTEVLVARLVAQGLTSPQIATQLYVSPRTVQTHVSHILRKLGLRSRVELAAVFARGDVEEEVRG